MDRHAESPVDSSSTGPGGWRTRGRDARSAVGLLLVLALSACGGSSSASDDVGRSGAPDGSHARGEDASAAALASELAADGSPLSADQASCLATVLIEVIDDAGILDPAAAFSDDPADLLIDGADLTALDSAAIGAGVAACEITFGVMIAEAMGGDVDGALVECLDGQFTPDVIGQVLLSEMTGVPIGDRTSEDISRGAAIACAHHLPHPSGDQQ